LKGWFSYPSETQPQYILQAALGAVICVYPAALLMRQLLRVAACEIDSAPPTLKKFAFADESL